MKSVQKIWADCFTHGDIEYWSNLDVTVEGQCINFIRPLDIQLNEITKHSIGKYWVLDTSGTFTIKNNKGLVNSFKNTIYNSVPYFYRNKYVNLYYGSIDMDNRKIDIVKYSDVSNSTVIFVKMLVEKNSDKMFLFDIKRIKELAKFVNFEINITEYGTLKNIDVVKELYDNKIPIDIDMRNLPYRIDGQTALKTSDDTSIMVQMNVYSSDSDLQMFKNGRYPYWRMAVKYELMI